MGKSRDGDEARVKRKQAKKQKLVDKHGVLADAEEALPRISKHGRKMRSEEAVETRTDVPEKRSKHKKSSSKALHNEQHMHFDSSSVLNSENLTPQGQPLLDDVSCDNEERSDNLYGKKVKISGNQVGGGAAVCEMTDVSDDFMSSDKIKKKVKKKRDRWGQVVNTLGDMQNLVSEADILENAEICSSQHANGDRKRKNDMYEAVYDNKTVCAGGMPYGTTEADIRETFKECGFISHVVCMKFADTQRFKGLAFVTFKTEAAAEKALSLDGIDMGGRFIKVEKARAGRRALHDPPSREPGSLSVYIGNLNWDIKKADIKHFFKGCAIDDVRLAVDRETGNLRGYGHVDFSDEKSLETAIKMNQKQLLGRPVKVSYAVFKSSSVASKTH